MTNKTFCVLYTSLLSLILGSCTYSITMVHTEGTASDVVDEQQTPTANVSPDIKVSPI
jgi:hypothetical protein